ncbi:hypothetical protein Tco_0495976 [Tanacetum coccineum]
MEEVRCRQPYPYTEAERLLPKALARGENRTLDLCLQRNMLEEDMEDHVLMLREKEQMIKKLMKYLVVLCVMLFESCVFFSTWMAFGGNIRDLGSFGEETNEITDLHQILEEVLLTEHKDDITGIKQRRRDPSSDGVTAKLRNDILMFQQHHGESLSEAWTRFKNLLQKFSHHGIDLWLKVQIFYDHVNPVIRRTIDQSAGDKLRDQNAEESWALLEDLALYDNESWNDPKDFAKPVKAIALPQDVPSTSDRHLIELENQVQRLMETHLAQTQPTQVNKITTSCEICSGPHDTQYYMEDPE